MDGNALNSDIGGLRSWLLAICRPVSTTFDFIFRLDLDGCLVIALSFTTGAAATDGVRLLTGGLTLESGTTGLETTLLV